MKCKIEASPQFHPTQPVGKGKFVSDRSVSSLNWCWRSFCLAINKHKTREIVEFRSQYCILNLQQPPWYIFRKGALRRRLNSYMWANIRNLEENKIFNIHIYFLVAGSSFLAGRPSAPHGWRDVMRCFALLLCASTCAWRDIWWQTQQNRGKWKQIPTQMSIKIGFSSETNWKIGNKVLRIFRFLIHRHIPPLLEDLQFLIYLFQSPKGCDFTFPGGPPIPRPMLADNNDCCYSIAYSGNSILYCFD